MRWVSSFFLKVAPSSLDAAMISAARRSAMLFSLRLREKSMSHFMAMLSLRLSRMGVGIWKVAPPTRRLRTSTAGVTFSSAFLKSSRPSSPVRSDTRSMAL